MTRLNNGDAFPRLSLSRTGGGTLNLPEDLKGSFGVVLIYRGAWCPYCNTQLAAFERLSARLTDAGIKVAALSVDDEATTAALVAKAKPKNRRIGFLDFTGVGCIGGFLSAGPASIAWR